MIEEGEGKDLNLQIVGAGATAPVLPLTALDQEIGGIEEIGEEGDEINYFIIILYYFYFYFFFALLINILFLYLHIYVLIQINFL